MQLLKQENELIFGWKALAVFLLLLSMLQYSTVVAKTYGFNEIKAQVDNVEPVTIHPAKPIRPVRPRYMSVFNAGETIKHNKKDVDCLAKNIYHESGTESKLGKFMVAQVTINRARSDNHAGSICSVVYEPGQFSWTSSKKRYKVPKGKLWEESKQVALDVINGGKRVYGMENAMYFHAAYTKPYWTHNRAKLAQIGLHIFYG